MRKRRGYSSQANLGACEWHASADNANKSTNTYSNKYKIKYANTNTKTYTNTYIQAYASINVHIDRRLYLFNTPVCKNTSVSTSVNYCSLLQSQFASIRTAGSASQISLRFLSAGSASPRGGVLTVVSGLVMSRHIMYGVDRT